MCDDIGMLHQLLLLSRLDYFSPTVKASQTRNIMGKLIHALYLYGREQFQRVSVEPQRNPR